jgi:hypothetical protein
MYILSVILRIVPDLSMLCLFIQNRICPINITIVHYRNTGNVFQVFSSSDWNTY